jgi:hypothetical protein
LDLADGIFQVFMRFLHMEEHGLQALQFTVDRGGGDGLTGTAARLTGTVCFVVLNPGRRDGVEGLAFKGEKSE